MAKQADLLSVEAARERILAKFERLETEFVPLEACLARVLAESVTSPGDVPPFSNSSMDGFAVQSGSTRAAQPEHPVKLTIGQNIPAGTYSSRAVTPAECARIMTGAPLPPGADAVVPFEEVEELGTSIALTAPIASGACIRPAGHDLASGAELVPPGTVITSRHIGLLAAAGIARVAVVRRPTIAVLSTGDELVKPGVALQPGQIYNSNSPMLAAAVSEAGATPLILDPAPDDPTLLAEAIAGAAGADLLLTSGGASVGDFDFMKDVVGGGGELDFWRVRVRPGKPLLFGSVGSLQVIGLPGNPTSGMVTFELFARPAIRKMLGTSLLRPVIQVQMDECVDNRGGRRTYARARLHYDGGYHARLSGPQDSAMLMPLAEADGLVVIPEDRPELKAGDTAQMQIWRLPDAD